MKNAIAEKFTISPLFIFFLMYASMVEVGILRYQHDLIQYAGYNAWISVLLTGISIHLILWMIYKILSANKETPDIITVNHKCFGKMFGNVLNSTIVLYFILGAFITFRTYISVIQICLFPNTNNLPLSIIIVLLLYYAVSGGFRSVTGICFWGVLFSILIIVPLTFLQIQYWRPQNLFPLFDHSVTDILYSSKSMVPQYLGFEALLIYYPFINTPAKSQKWAQLAVITVTLLYFALIMVTFMYFSEGQLQQTVWPTLNIVMIMQLPLLQRLEYLIVSVLFVKIIANIALGLWVACRGTKAVFQIKQSLTLIIFLAGFIILHLFTKEIDTIKRISDYYSTIGSYFIYVYIPIVFLIMEIRKKRQDEYQ